MKISIITICYNDREGFLKTARSVIAQTYHDFEWIAIDGGSSDGSAEAIKGYSNHMSYWISESDKGIYNAMNKGIARAQGDYCLFLNSGDQFCSPKSLKKVASKEWSADIVSCDMFLGGESRWNSAYINAPAHAGFLRIAKKTLAHQATFIKTSLLNDLKYQEDYKIVSDWIFWFQVLVVKGGTYQNINIPITVFDITGISSLPNERHKEERRDFLKQYIRPEITDKVLEEFSIEKAIDSAYVMTSERKILHVIFNLVNWIYSTIIYRIAIRYKCIKYRRW